MKNKKNKFPMFLHDRSIHIYEHSGINGYCIGHSQDINDDEVMVDDEECECEDLTERKYINFLKRYGAKVYPHKFEYSDGSKRTAHDSYFENLDDAVKCVEALDKRVPLVMRELAENYL